MVRNSNSVAYYLGQNRPCTFSQLQDYSLAFVIPSPNFQTPSFSHRLINLSRGTGLAHCSRLSSHLTNVIISCPWPQKRSYQPLLQTLNGNASRRTNVASKTGNGGVHTYPNDNGERCERIIPRTALCGRTSHMIKRVAEPIAGARMDSSVSPIANAACASPSRCGTVRTRSSRNDSSVSVAQREITERMLRSATTTSIQLLRTPT